MKLITTNSIDKAYIRLCRMFVRQGTWVQGSKGSKLKTLGQVCITITDPTRVGLMNFKRNLSLRYAAGEVALMLQGSHELNDFAHYSKAWRKLSPDGLTVNSAYGYRMFVEHNGAKWAFAKSQLLKSETTKNAVIDMREPRDRDDSFRSDYCCTLSLKFSSIGNGKLDLTVVMRSSDVWLGLPYDVCMYAVCLSKMAYEVNMDVGSLTMILLDSHCYEKNFNSIVDAEQEPITTESAVLPLWNSHCADRLAEFAKFERRARAVDVISDEARDLCKEIYAAKLPPLLETLLAWITTPFSRISLSDRRAQQLSDLSRDRALTTECVDRQVKCLIVGAEEDAKPFEAKGVNTVRRCNRACDDKQNRVCEVDHAEIVALRKFAQMFPNKRPTTAYVTLAPCADCRRALEEAGVAEIITKLPLHKTSSGTARLCVVAEDQ